MRSIACLYTVHTHTRPPKLHTSHIYRSHLRHIEIHLFFSFFVSSFHSFCVLRSLKFILFGISILSAVSVHCLLVHHLIHSCYFNFSIEFIIFPFVWFCFFMFSIWHRKKRAISDWLIAPNTKWCGRGQTADKYSELGGASKADKCCRRHDHCKFNIYGMSTKWRLFNYQPFTISHCNCDARFVIAISHFFFNCKCSCLQTREKKNWPALVSNEASLFLFWFVLAVWNFIAIRNKSCFRRFLRSSKIMLMIII